MLSRLLVATFLAGPALILTACSDEESVMTDDDAVVGGEKETGYAEVGQLLYGAPGSVPERFFCTGTLVAPRVVVTAAHCLLSISEKFESPEVAFVAGGDRYDATYGEVHPANVNGMTSHTDDVAFIILDKEVRGITPAKLASFATTVASDAGKDAATSDAAATDAGAKDAVAKDGASNEGDGGNGTKDASPKGGAASSCDYKLVGFGQTTEGAKAPVIEPNRRSLEVCSVAGPWGFISVTNENGSTCYGDSGGPLFEKGKHTILGVLNGSATVGCVKGRINDYVDLSLQAPFLAHIDTALEKY